MKAAALVLGSAGAEERVFECTLERLCRGRILGTECVPDDPKEVRFQVRLPGVMGRVETDEGSRLAQVYPSARELVFVHAAPAGSGWGTYEYMIDLRTMALLLIPDWSLGAKHDPSDPYWAGSCGRAPLLGRGPAGGSHG